jgi:DNA-directed RNA polymerase subunit N (RpoN/RPB10)
MEEWEMFDRSRIKKCKYKQFTRTRSLMTQQEKDNQVSKLIQELPLRYCCKMRFMTYKDSVEFIIPAKD